MIYTVYNGCIAIAQYKQQAAAIKRAKKQFLLNLIDEMTAEITVVSKRYTSDPNVIQVYSSFNED